VKLKCMKVNAKLKGIISERERVRYRFHHNPHNNGNHIQFEKHMIMNVIKDKKIHIKG
jgi:hypothetical protein